MTDNLCGIRRDFPYIDSVVKCEVLSKKYAGKKIIALLATVLPLQNVDVLWRLRKELLEHGLPVVFFYNESALEMLDRIWSMEKDASIKGEEIAHFEHIYRVDDIHLFSLMDFIEVAITNDYYCNYPLTNHIRGKLVSMPHHAGVYPPTLWSYPYDYVVSDKPSLVKYPYEQFPNSMKIHRNRDLTLLRAGHPKLDLVLEERSKAASEKKGHPPVFLIYPQVIAITLREHNISPDKFYEDMTGLAEGFLAIRPEGKVVFRPFRTDVDEPLPKKIAAHFKDEPRFIMDVHADNKYWMARADYFLTDYSDGYINWCMTSARPAIFFKPDFMEATPSQSIWGYIINETGQLPEILKEIGKKKRIWNMEFLKKRKIEMPMLGKCFSLLGKMIKRIYENNDDPAWPKLDKGNHPCDTPAKLLKMISRMCSRGNYNSYALFDVWFEQFQNAVPIIDKRIYLYLLRRGLDFRPGKDTIAFGYGARLGEYLEQALLNLPVPWVTGTIAHAMKKNPQSAKHALLAMAIYGRRSRAQLRRLLQLLLISADNYDDALVKFKEEMKEINGTYSRGVFSVLQERLPQLLAMRPGTARKALMQKTVKECQEAGM